MLKKIRIAKFIANAGFCSRREAEKLIEDKIVKINNDLCLHPSETVNDNDKITIGKKTIKSQNTIKLWKIYKPIKYICSTKDDQNRKKIFDNKGENYFRKIEEQITLKKLKLNSSVISLGGGAFINKKIREEVIKNHISFWLNLDRKILLDRIKNSKKRPLTINASNDELIDLIKKRSNIYSKALYEIKCDNLTKSEIVNKIVKIYESN